MSTLYESELDLNEEYMKYAFEIMYRYHSSNMPINISDNIKFRKILIAMSFILKLIENKDCEERRAEDTQKLVFLINIMALSYSRETEWMECEKLINFLSNDPQPPIVGLISHIRTLISA